jgi:threo-3-hydroxy-L-aspartate ammonia-lyase
LTDVIDIRDVRAAAEQIAGVANRTPVLTSRTLDERLSARVFLKAENYQRTGSFKFRGAYNRTSRLSDEELSRGVVAVSSGNHAQAVALAAKLLGTTAVILMPSDAPDAKRLATASYGAEIIEFDRYAQDRDVLVSELVARHGGTFVPPYDHPHIMAGQGTAGLELVEEAGPLDVLVAPVSGGGLIAGCGVAAKTLCPGVRLVGVEPMTADDTRRSLEAGERLRTPVARTIADGLQVDTPGELTFEVNRRQIDEIVLVSDAEIVDAMRFAHDTMKTVVEPSGAAALASLLAGRLDIAGQRVGVILSGGNIGARRFAELLAG